MELQPHGYLKAMILFFLSGMQVYAKINKLVQKLKTLRSTSSHQVIMPVLLRVYMFTRHVGFNWIIFGMIHGQIHKTDRVS